MNGVERLVERLSNVAVFVADTIENIEDGSLDEAEASHWRAVGQDMDEALAQAQNLLTAS